MENKRIITHIAFLPDNRSLITADDGGILRLWPPLPVPDPVRGRGIPTVMKELRRINASVGSIRSFALARDGSFLVVGGDSLRLFDTKTWKSKEFPLHLPRFGGKPLVQALAFTPDNHQTLVVGLPGELQFWNPLNLTKIASHRIGTYHREPTRLVFDRNGQRLAVGDSQGNISVWELLPMRSSETDAFLGASPRAEASGHTEPITDLKFTADGRTLLSGSVDRTVRLWDPVGGQERAAFTSHGDRIVWLEIPNPNTILTLDRDGVLKIWRGVKERK